MNACIRVALASVALVALVAACSTPATYDSKRYRPVTLKDFGLSYVEPLGNHWELLRSKPVPSALLVLNYSSKSTPGRHLSILVEKTAARSAGDTNVQAAFLAKILPNTMSNKVGHLGDDLGPPTYVVELTYRHPSGAIQRSKAFLCIANGFAFQVMVTSFAASVDEDPETIPLVRGLRISERKR